MSTEVLSKTELMDKLERAKKGAARVRAEANAITERGVNGILTVAGGATSGVIRGVWGDAAGNAYWPGSEIEIGASVGTVLALSSTLGLAGKASDALAHYTFGMLSGETAFEVRDAIKLLKAKNAG
jgi:hypothetical protein